MLYPYSIQQNVMLYPYSTAECYVVPVQYNRMLCCTRTVQQNVEKIKQKSSGWKHRMKIPHYKVQKSRLQDHSIISHDINKMLKK